MPEQPGSKAHEERLRQEREADKARREFREETERMRQDAERAERMRGQDRPTDSGVTPDEAKALGDLLGAPRTQQPPTPPAPTPPPPATPVPATGGIDDWKPRDWWSPMRLPTDVRGCLPLIAGGGLTLLGLAMIAWAFTGGRSDYGVVPGSPIATAPAATAAASPPTAQIGGFTIAYRGPLTIRNGETLNVVLQVLDAQGRAAQGTAFGTLAPAGGSPSSPNASHGNAVLDAMGQATIPLGVNSPAGTTTLFTSWQGTVAPLATITVQEGAAASGTRTATASLSFTRTSGPATLARTFSDRFNVRWNARMVDLTQLSNNHMATGTRTGDSFTARGTDGQEYRGTISESGGAAVFQGQLTGPNNSYVYSFNGETVGPITTSAPAAVATTAPPTPAASPTATATATTAGTQSDPNYPLAGAGLLLSIGGLGLGLFGGRYLRGMGGKNSGGLVFPIPYTGGGAVQTKDKDKEEADRCARERAREAEARARLDAARQRFEALDELRDKHAQAQINKAQAENPVGPRGMVEKATASRELRDAATSAQNAWDAAGNGSAHSAAQEELNAAQKAWEAADAALRGCMGGPGGRGR